MWTVLTRHGKLFYIVCVCTCMCVYVFVMDEYDLYMVLCWSIGTWMSWHKSLGQRTTMGNSVYFLSGSRQDLLFTIIHARLADPYASRGSPSSTSHVTTGTLRLQIHATESGFTWVRGSNPTPYPFAASALPTEPSPQSNTVLWTQRDTFVEHLNSPQIVKAPGLFSRQTRV